VLGHEAEIRPRAERSATETPELDPRLRAIKTTKSRRRASAGGFGQRIMAIASAGRHGNASPVGREA